MRRRIGIHELQNDLDAISYVVMTVSSLCIMAIVMWAMGHQAQGTVVETIPVPECEGCLQSTGYPPLSKRDTTLTYTPWVNGYKCTDPCID